MKFQGSEELRRLSSDAAIAKEQSRNWYIGILSEIEDCLFNKFKQEYSPPAICYHSTTKDRVDSIIKNGLLPDSPPTWFSSPAPYVMLSEKPWPELNGCDNVILEISDPAIRQEYFDDPEGLRWPYTIAPRYIQVRSLSPTALDIEVVE